MQHLISTYCTILVYTRQELFIKWLTFTAKQLGKIMNGMAVSLHGELQ
ncbi:hypothetical protein HMPREF3293_01299 [Christensenella minuta]|uniref:Uncharacterized protein n=1 Tax=Christensenella minuta TaxID=626937 RepID=A0A136Q5H7_9FIRM|nr:hypothetical protein HMPREF3293_01299 [Christensenella minuta]